CWSSGLPFLASERGRAGPPRAKSRAFDRQGGMGGTNTGGSKPIEGGSKLDGTQGRRGTEGRFHWMVGGSKGHLAPVEASSARTRLFQRRLGRPSFTTAIRPEVSSRSMARAKIGFPQP